MKNVFKKIIISASLLSVVSVSSLTIIPSTVIRAEEKAESAEVGSLTPVISTDDINIEPELCFDGRVDPNKKKISLVEKNYLCNFMSLVIINHFEINKVCQ